MALKTTILEGAALQNIFLVLNVQVLVVGTLVQILLSKSLQFCALTNCDLIPVNLPAQTLYRVSHVRTLYGPLS